MNQVVPRDDLHTFTLEMASHIASRPLFALQVTKEAVNATQDAQGRLSAPATSFASHQLCHSHNQLVHGALIDAGFFERAWGARRA